MTPTEYEGQIAIDAAAKKAYEDLEGRRSAIENRFPTLWEQLPLAEQNQWRDAVLQIVWAALLALPDRLAEIRLVIDNPHIDQVMKAGLVKGLLEATR